MSSSHASPEEPEWLPTRPGLLARLRNQADSASWHRGWEEFYTVYGPVIFQYARKRDLSETDAEDLVQEVVAGLARQLIGFIYDPQRGSFKTWLFRICRNKVVDHLRRQGRGIQRILSGGTDDGLSTWLRLFSDANGRWLYIESPGPNRRDHLLRASNGEPAADLVKPWLAIGSRSRLHAEHSSTERMIYITDRERTDSVPISIDGTWSKDTLTFSADEKYFAAGNNDGSVLVADIEAVRERRGSQNHQLLLPVRVPTFGVVGAGGGT